MYYRLRRKDRYGPAGLGMWVPSNVQAQGRCAALSRSVPWSAVLGSSFAVPPPPTFQNALRSNSYVNYSSNSQTRHVSNAMSCHQIAGYWYFRKRLGISLPSFRQNFVGLCFQRRPLTISMIGHPILADWYFRKHPEKP